jgi:hypothetical protein
MSRSEFYLVHLLTLFSGLIVHSQCSTLARYPSNAKMTEGILTQPSLQSLKLSSYEAYDQCGNTDLAFFCSRLQNSTKTGSLKFGNK